MNCTSWHPNPISRKAGKLPQNATRLEFSVTNYLDLSNKNKQFLQHNPKC